MFTRFLIFIFILTNIDVVAQLQLNDTRNMAMGNSSVATVSVYGNSINIASLVFSKGSFVNLSATNLYFIKSLSPVSVSGSKKFESTAIFLSAERMGSVTFSEQFFETGISKKLSQKFSIGVKVKYFQSILNESEYWNSSAFIPEVGLFAMPLPNISFGFIVRNPVRARMNDIEKKLPSVIHSGISSKLSEKVQLNFSVLQKSDSPLSFQSGIEYAFHKNVFFRIGFHTLPTVETIGFGINVTRFQCDLVYETNPVLGNSSSITINFPFE